MIVAKFVLVALIGYFIGAIPVALIISKRMAGIDISKRGSGNIGGTNVLRVVGHKAGVLTMALDIVKGLVPVILARFIIGDSLLSIAGFTLDWRWGQVITALMVMVGHNWSVYIRFHGGKGAAVYFGSWFAMWPVVGLFGGIILVITVLLSKYMSLGSILGSLSILCLSIVMTLTHTSPPVYLIYSVVAAGLIVYQHRSNISRLQTKTESRMDQGPNKLGL
jgi:glycerol-3-phosphate acyltransferase PlsY